MESGQIKESQQNIYKSLNSKHLKNALDNLGGLTATLSDWSLRDKLNEIENNYKYMLSYMEKGMADPERGALYRKLLADTYHLTDIVTDKLLMRDCSTIYYSKKRVGITRGVTIDGAFSKLDNALSDLSLCDLLSETPTESEKVQTFRRSSEAGAEELFDSIWCNFPSNTSDIDALKRVFSPGSMPAHFMSLMVSALTLSLLEWFEEQKFTFLTEIAYNKEEMVRQRALVGIALVLLRHTERIYNSDVIAKRLGLLIEDPQMAGRLRAIQAQLIRSRETEKITRKLNEEILPEMIKITPDLYNMVKDDDATGELGNKDMNPEWDDMLNNSRIGDKLKEISELQSEGSDVLLGAFSNLKNFAFFQQPCNWFIPFFTTNTALDMLSNKESGNQTMLEFIENSMFICNSDKYSFCLSMMHMPTAELDMLTQQFSEKKEELKEISEDIDGLDEKKLNSISNLYIQDIYRFYKIYSRHNEFTDPFNSGLSFFKLPVIKNIFYNKEELHFLAELFFRKEFYIDAHFVFEEILKIDATDSGIYQKLGYCLQIGNDWNGALRAYLQAEMINPDSVWTLRRIALCYRNLKMYDDALKYYTRLETLNPDNLPIELNIGHCLLQKKDYEGALKRYFKVDYLDSKSHKTWRPIAWCSFLLGKFDQARKYYARIIEQGASYHDYFNAGHTEWAMGNIPQAMELYRKSLEVDNMEKKRFEENFRIDTDDLIKAGINPSDIPLMIDQVLYETE